MLRPRLMPFQPRAVARNPIIMHGYSDDPWKSFQLQFPIIAADPSDPNPTNPNRLQMILDGTWVPGRLDGVVTAPDVWYEHAGNPLLNRNTYGFYIDCELKVGSTFNYFTSYLKNPVFTRIDLYTAPDRVTWTPSPSNPVLVPTGDETGISTHSVIDDTDISGKYWGYYNYLTASLTYPGVRVASSTNLTTWTRPTNNTILLGDIKKPWGLQFEGHRAKRMVVNRTTYYVLLCSCFNSTRGGPMGTWSANVFFSRRPDGDFRPSLRNPIFEQTINRKFAAEFFDYVFGGRGWLYYQYSRMLGNYGLQTWDIGAAQMLQANFWENVLQ